jgi:hypothetical protein
VVSKTSWLVGVLLFWVAYQALKATHFFTKMKQGFIDHHLIFDAAVRRIGDNLDDTFAWHTDFHINT